MKLRNNALYAHYAIEICLFIFYIYIYRKYLHTIYKYMNVRFVHYIIEIYLLFINIMSIYKYANP